MMKQHYEIHAELKRDRAAFEAATTFYAWQPLFWIDDAIELRTCNDPDCQSTLCDGTLRSGRKYQDLDVDLTVDHA